MGLYPEDIYFKKIVTLNHGGQVLHFRVAQDLFSSQAVDTGTQRLLRSIPGVIARDGLKILDLGCGYGPIGVAVKKTNPDCVLHMVDRDALAVAYSRQNMALNHLPAGEIYGSLGYDDVTGTGFDLILSNMPGKAGDAVISSLLLDAFHYLKPGGRVAIVVVTPLEALVTSILTAPGIEILHHRQWHGHTVFHYRFSDGFRSKGSPGRALERGVYHRARVDFSFQGHRFILQTAHGLPEFDTLSYRSELLLEGIAGIQRKDTAGVLVMNPNQGHIPVVLWEMFKPASIVLVDRDLLSLRYSTGNLVGNGCPEQHISSMHQAGIPPAYRGKYDLIAATLREEEGPRAIALTVNRAAALLSAGGVMLVAGSSTSITRLENAVRTDGHARVRERRRNRGESLLVLARR